MGMEVLVLLTVGLGLESRLWAQAAQRIVEEPSDVRVLRGEPAQLTCRVEGQRGPVQWTRDGFGLGKERDLPDWDRFAMVGSSADGEYHLRIDAVHLADDADFRCQMGPTTDAKGALSRPARLTVLAIPGTPRLLNHEDLLSTTEDRAFSLTCAVDGGKPRPKVQWLVTSASDGSGVLRKLGSASEGDSGEEAPLVSEEADTGPDGLVSLRSTLRYSPQRADDGKFVVCQSSHETLKEPNSAAAMVQVSYRPRVTVALGKDEKGREPKLREGRPATLLCSADAKPSEGLRYAWKRDGSVLTREHRRRLHIPALQFFHHQAVFECEVTNQVGVGSAAYTAAVAYGPRMPANETVALDEGETLQLACPADGNPPPSIVWTRVGSASVLGAGANLTVPALKAWQAGRYQCEATVQGFPSKTSSHTVHINGPPSVLMAPVVEGAEGSTVEVLCDVKGFPLPSAIHWRKGGRLLDMKLHPSYSLRQLPQDEGVVSILKVEAVSPEDLDTFNCSARNRFGAASASSRLTAANPFPLYILIPCLVGGVVLVSILILCLVLCSRRSFCSAKSSHRSGDSHSDVTVKVEALDGSGLPLNGLSYYSPDLYSPQPEPSHGGQDAYGKEYIPLPQDNPDLDQLPPPYSYGHAHQGPPPTSTFSRDGGDLLHMPYPQDQHHYLNRGSLERQKLNKDENKNGDSGGGPIVYTDQFGNILAEEYPAGYPAYGVPDAQGQYWTQGPSQPVYYPSSSQANGGGPPLAVLEPVPELPTPGEGEGRPSSTFRGGGSLGGRPSSGEQSSPTTQVSHAGSSTDDLRHGSHVPPPPPILSSLNDSGFPPSSLNSTNV